MNSNADKPSIKNVLSSTSAILAMLIVLPIIVSLWILFNYVIESQKSAGETTIKLPEETFETLVIKITYPYQLNVIVEDIVYGRVFENCFIGEIGETLRFELHENKELRIQPINSTLHIFIIENLKNKVENFNFYLNGYLLKAEVSVLNIRHPSRDNLPEDISQYFEKLLKKHDFIKWLDDECLNYTIIGIRPLRVCYPFHTEPHIYCLEFEANLLVEGVRIKCRFNRFILPEFGRVTTSSNLIEKLQINPNEGESVVCIYVYRRNEKEYVLGVVLNSYAPHSERSYNSIDVLLENEPYIWLPHGGIRYYRHLNYFKAYVFNETSEEGEKAIRILESNRLTRKLLESKINVLCFLKRQIGEDKELPIEASFLFRNSTLTALINIDDGKIEKIILSSIDLEE